MTCRVRQLADWLDQTNGGPYDKSRYRQYGRSAYDHNAMLVDGLAQSRTAPQRSDIRGDARPD